MIKTEYLDYEMDTAERQLKEGGWQVIYINTRKRDMVIGKGHKLESACADAQRKIKKKVE